MNKIKRLIINTVLSDAMAAPFEGFSKGHISSSFYEEDGSLLIKLNPKETDKWKKPMLYSSMSQLMILTSLLINKKASLDPLKKILKSLNEKDGKTLFRHYDNGEKQFLNGSQSEVTSARLLTMAVPLGLLQKKTRLSFKQKLEYCVSITVNIQVIHGILLISDFIDSCSSENSEKNDLNADSALKHFSLLNKQLTENYNENSPEIFNAGLNPDHFIRENQIYTDILRNASDTSSSLEACIKSMISVFNNYMPHNITRLTINHPAAVIGACAAYGDLHNTGGWQCIKDIISQGGSAQAGAFMSSLIMSLKNDDFHPDEAHFNAMINKNRINSISDLIASASPGHSDIDDFIKNEQALSTKEREEYGSKNKHSRKKPKKSDQKKKKQSREDELNRHVVESWTKVDKAKWRKKRDKFSPDDADNI